MPKAKNHSNSNALLSQLSAMMAIENSTRCEAIDIRDKLDNANKAHDAADDALAKFLRDDHGAATHQDAAALVLIALVALDDIRAEMRNECESQMKGDDLAAHILTERARINERFRRPRENLIKVLAALQRLGGFKLDGTLKSHVVCGATDDMSSALRMLTSRPGEAL